MIKGTVHNGRSFQPDLTPAPVDLYHPKGHQGESGRDEYLNPSLLDTEARGNVGHFKQKLCKENGSDGP